MYEYKAEVRRVVDGDTVDVTIDCGFNIHIKERVRLSEVWPLRQDLRRF